MGIEIATARPPRCLLVNVTTSEIVQCLFNPTQLSERTQVNYSRLAVPGLSHQVLQFRGTGNRQLAGVEFYLDRFFVAAEEPQVDIRQFRAFLRALTVPPSGTTGAAETTPPRVLVIWPKVLTLEAVLTAVEFQYRQLAVDGAVLVYTATCSFEEILDVRVTADELREDL